MMSPILPLNNHFHFQHWRRTVPARAISPNYIRSAAVFVLCITALFFWSQHLPSESQSSISLVPNLSPKLPPTFAAHHEFERNLPQHNASQERGAKYLFVANHVTGVGFGNVMQEYILNSFLAIALDRIMVFDNYTWSADRGTEFVKYGNKLIPSRIPISAFLSGPLGGQAPPDFSHSQLISRAYFDEVCEGRKTVYHTEDFKSRVGSGNLDGKTLFGAWVSELGRFDEPCLEFDSGPPEIFDIWLFGASGIHSLVDLYKTSENMHYFAFSPLVHEIFIANVNLFAPWSELEPNLSEVSVTSWPDTPTIPGLMALHIRRGDFEAHCDHLAKWSSTFHGLNTMTMNNLSHSPAHETMHPDRFVPPSGAGYGETTQRNYETYRTRCYPDIESISRKVTMIRQSYADRYPGKKLSNIYVMTNGNTDWLSSLKLAIQNYAEFEGTTIYTSRDLVLTDEQSYVALALDMYVGSRAEMFVGNGFSSLTSNVAVLRMVRGVEPLDTRFW